ncbi:PhoH family protein [Candidatus Woesearchaeota archaeon]|nr:PhoH family protein [Candidatus Woesearchaeota archaeon]
MVGEIHNYILDTNVLIGNPDAIHTFDGNNIYLPITVIRELDKLKKGTGEVAFSAREALRNIGKLTDNVQPDEIQEGIKLGDGSTFYLCDEKKRSEYGDDDILDLAEKIKNEHKNQKTVLVSKDTAVRIRAKSRGIFSEDYFHDKAQVDFDEMFSIQDQFTLPDESLANMFSGSKDGKPNIIEIPESLEGRVQQNQYFEILSNDASYRLHVKVKGTQLVSLSNNRRTQIEGIKARNSRQLYLLDACLDQEVPIVNGLGRAGTGKTLMAIIAGLNQINHLNEKYERIMVFRPLVDAGSSEIGFLPGRVEDKIGPYFGAIKNLVDFVLKGPGTQTLLAEEKLIFNPPNYLRGDTVNNTYIIVDEAQNFTNAELRLIGTRMGQNCKMVTVGDPFQSDLRFNNDERDNALTKATAYFKNLKKPTERALFAYVVLNEVERSKSAAVWGKF